MKNEFKQINQAKSQYNYYDRYTKSESTNKDGVFDYDMANGASDKRMNDQERKDMLKHINDMIAWHKTNNTDYSHYLQMKIYYKLV